MCAITEKNCNSTSLGYVVIIFFVIDGILIGEGGAPPGPPLVTPMAMIPSTDVAEAFWILADYMPEHENMPELLTYFEQKYIRGRRRPGRIECYRSALYPIETRNHFKSASEGSARTTNSNEGWHYGLQALFQCHYSTLWTFIKGLEKNMQMRHPTFAQGISGLQPFIPKPYQSVKLRVANGMARYLLSEILVYLRGTAYFPQTLIFD